VAPESPCMARVTMQAWFCRVGGLYPE